MSKKTIVTGHYVWYNQAYASSGTYTHEYNNNFNCVSVDTLKLVVNTVGALPGIFSVSTTKKVKFSKGNLQYRASDGMWQFAEYQTDRIGNAEGNTTQSSRGSNSKWIDLFGWGTSGFQNPADACNVRPYPYQIANSGGQCTYNEYGYGPSFNMMDPNLTGADGTNDWGWANRIYNGGNQTRLWRTLTNDEWKYLFNTRTASTVCGVSNARFCHARVDGRGGIVLFPDNYVHPEGGIRLTGINANTYYDYNNIEWSGWLEMESAGAVFLPSAGYRNNYTVSAAGNSGDGYYWSATAVNSSSAYCVYFGENTRQIDHVDGRQYGFSVRLVQDAQ